MIQNRKSLSNAIYTYKNSLDKSKCKRIITELTDKMPAECIEIADLSFRYKCAAFSAPSYVSLIQLIYTAESPSYKAKNLKNAVNYKNG